MTDHEQTLTDLQAARAEINRLHRVMQNAEVSRDLTLLHPRTRTAFQELAIDLQYQFDKEYTKTNFRAFEGYRSVTRQRRLFKSIPQVTQADAWQSAHNYGCAVDFVAWSNDLKWSWDNSHDWAFLKKRAELFDLRVPITWDRGHVEHPYWQEFKDLR